MTAFKRIFKIYCKCVDGATAIEYGMIAAAIALAIAGAVFLLGVEVVGLYDGVVDAFQSS